MVVYHGSKASFNKFKIDKSLMRWESTQSNEGLGVYFSLNKDVAKCYGNYIYTLDIPTSEVVDFRKKGSCSKLIDGVCKQLHKEYHFNLGYYSDIILIKNCIQSGHIGIWEGIGREVCLWLDSSDKWYSDNVIDLSDVEKSINQYIQNKYKAYLFSYHIPDVGVIKDVNLITIINKEYIK